MTTPQQTRIVLSEIPDLEGLRVSTPALANNRRSPNDPVPANIFNAPIVLLDNTTNVALSQEFMMSPVPSPDELVIRQRGRRRLTGNLSPAATTHTPIRSPFQRTPTKMPLSTSIILRSSPRKRLTMGSTPPDVDVSASPTKARQLWPSTPIVKKIRLEEDERPFAQLNNDVPLKHLLQGMSHQQLIDIIVNDMVGDNIKAEEQLRAKLPLPDLSFQEQELLHAKRNIFKSLPTSRLCKKTDSTSYTRAAIHLAEFRRLLSSHTSQLHDSSHWDALLDYVTMAWPCVRATPLFDSATHNAVRRQCFKLLACNCIASVKYGGLRLGANRLHTLERNLREWSKDYEEVLSCINTLNKTLTKGRSSM